jgi:hypothetical protein
MAQEIKFLDVEELRKAQAGSYYTLIGVGGDPQEWIDGYEKWLADEGIGKPVSWFHTNGGAVNALAGVVAPSTQAFASDLGFLLFPLDGLDIGKLAMFKIAHEDRWFDDIIGNMR